MLLGAILIILCGPFESPVIAGYLMPLIFILFTLAISRLTYALFLCCGPPQRFAVDLQL
jgi:hypothetical protein